MKVLRRLLIGLAAPLAFLIGLTQLAGTPVYKGYNTGFEANVITADQPKLAIATDAGDLTCWVRLRLPLQAQSVSANLSTGTPLHVYQDSVEGPNQWLAIVGETQKPQEKFTWPAGAILYLTSTDGRNLMPDDWRVYLSDKTFDSRDRARWRNLAFGVAIFFLFLMLIGITFEAWPKSKGEPTITSFTHERCLNELIMSTEGDSARETEWMRAILQKVLLQTIPVRDALAPLPLKKAEKQVLWFKTRNQFRTRLERLIFDLDVDLSYLRS